MGHANVKNLSQFFVRRLYAKGTLSISKATKLAVKAGETVHASEGEYDDEGTVGMCMSAIVHALASYHEDLVEGSWGPIIVPCDLTPRQEELLKKARRRQWDDFSEEDDLLYDKIKWMFGKGWRRRYPEIPILTYYEN